MGSGDNGICVPFFMFEPECINGSVQKSPGLTASTFYSQNPAMGPKSLGEKHPQSMGLAGFGIEMSEESLQLKSISSLAPTWLPYVSKDGSYTFIYIHIFRMVIEELYNMHIYLPIMFGLGTGCLTISHVHPI